MKPQYISSCQTKELERPLIPFNNVYLTGNELDTIKEVLESRQLASNGPVARKVHSWLNDNINSKAAFLTSSGTQALEMCALLLDAKPGDEVIMPSFTFVTTASAFVRANLVPVFVDVDENTLNIDPDKIEAAITDKTRAIVTMHYSGIACDMDRIIPLAEKYHLTLIEDACHSILAKYKDKFLGTFAPMSVMSFHETKNIVGGEAGVLLLNDKSLIDRATQIWQKGTNRHLMESGLAEKYTWTKLGSSFAANELTAAVVHSQLQEAHQITKLRYNVWQKYHELLAPLESKGLLKRPTVPPQCKPNGHIYYLLVESELERNDLIEHLSGEGIESVFHYIPLHSSPAGQHYGKCSGDLPITDRIASNLLRLPLWPELLEEDQKYIVKAIEAYFQKKKKKKK